MSAQSPVPGENQSLAETPSEVTYSRIRHLPYRRRKLVNPRFGFASGLKLRAKYERKTYLFAKRTMDIFGALAIMILLSPIYLIVAIGILISDGWPLFFFQRRIGQNGEVFKIFKFRSMVKNAEQILQSRPDLMEEYQRTFKIANDPRIFPLGNVIRRTSIDELPQMMNVLLGSMSLVGPRPHLEKDFQALPDEAKAVYTAMKPGCAGLWQCSGRSDLTAAERIVLDEQYYMSACVRNDVKILFMTAKTILKREGAH